MPRAAPRDDSYPAAYGLQLTGASADTDLTAQFVEAPYAACEVIVTNTDEAAEQNLVVRLQGAPSTDVTFTIAAGNTTWIRAAFVSFRTSTADTISATFLWQGGPS